MKPEVAILLGVGAYWFLSRRPTPVASTGAGGLFRGGAGLGTDITGAGSIATNVTRKDRARRGLNAASEIIGAIGNAL